MLASATEDGVVSIWSRNLASQRAIFMQASHAILQCTWDAKGTSIAAVAGQSLLLGSLQNGVVLSLDDAHEGLMLCVDWGGVHDMVVTGGEDCRYKVCVFCEGACWGVMSCTHYVCAGCCTTGCMHVCCGTITPTKDPYTPQPLTTPYT